MLQQLPNGYLILMGQIPFRRIRDQRRFRTGNILGNILVNIEPAILLHFENGCGREKFGVAGKAEICFRRGF